MKTSAYLKALAVMISMLVISLPMVFAEELNLQYDANGNLVTGDGKFREYNSLNHLMRVRNGSTISSAILEEFTYHPTQERVLVKKVYNSSAQVAETVIYIDENFVRVTNSSGNFTFTYVYDQGQMIGQRNPDGSKLFISSDPFGSSSVVTNGSGVVKENTSYSPDGEILSGGNANRFDYEDKEFDSLVGDYDFHFRKYDPDLKIFTQPDTLISNVYDPQSLNRYAFERGNPYSRVDPNGHVAPLLAAMGAGAIIGGAIGGLLYVGSHMISGEAMTWEGAGSYILGGAIAGALAPVGGALFGYGTSATAIGGAALTSSVGAGIGQMAMNYGDNQPIMSDVGSAMFIGGITGGFAQKFLPIARTWLIKYPLSYATTVTGNKFAINLFAQNIVANLLMRIAQNQMGNTKNNGGGSGYVSGVGYITSNGKIYPTNNPNWVPSGGGTSNSNSGSGGSSGGSSSSGGSGTCRATGNAQCPR